jgi:hypothetical protein
MAGLLTTAFGSNPDPISLQLLGPLSGSRELLTFAMAILAQSLTGLGLTLNQIDLTELCNVAARTGNLQELDVVLTPIAYL